VGSMAQQAFEVAVGSKKEILWRNVKQQGLLQAMTGAITRTLGPPWARQPFLDMPYIVYKDGENLAHALVRRMAGTTIINGGLALAGFADDINPVDIALSGMQQAIQLGANRLVGEVAGAPAVTSFMGQTFIRAANHIARPLLMNIFEPGTPFDYSTLYFGWGRVLGQKASQWGAQTLQSVGKSVVETLQ
ncbi:MAG TPA: hypothetical protein PLQ67_10585, partial [Burkholderiaceae bacterium]|nr:hypothetical protein [Burkholderiaceae bacterium]